MDSLHGELLGDARGGMQRKGLGFRQWGPSLTPSPKSSLVAPNQLTRSNVVPETLVSSPNIMPKDRQPLEATPMAKRVKLEVPIAITERGLGFQARERAAVAPDEVFINPSAV